MTQLRPLPILKSNPTPFHRDLLASAQLDLPSQDGKRRTLAALGLGGALIATTNTAAAVAMSGASGVSGVGVAAASSLPLGLSAALAKGLAIGVVCGTTLYGSIVTVRGPVNTADNTSSRQVIAGPARAVAVVSGVVARSPSEHADAPVDNDPLVNATPSPGAADNVGTKVLPKVARVSAPPPQTIPTLPASAATPVMVEPSVPPAALPQQERLSSEVVALDAARAWLAGNQPAHALQALQAYRAQFSRPRLLPESECIRVQALFALGQRDQARALGQQLITQYPNLPGRQRLRSLLGI